MRGVIFANGVIPSAERVRAFINEGDYLICADGGAETVKRINLVPHLIVGDLDSISQGTLEEFRQLGSRVEQYSTQKDETDLEVAVKEAIQKGCDDIVVCGALGGRFDHSLGNLSILRRKNPRNVRVWFDDGEVEVQMIRRSLKIHGQKGDLISLIPCSRRVLGIETEGLQYALKNATLFADRARGISNIMTNEQAIITVRGGELLCIHTRQHKKEV